MLKSLYSGVTGMRSQQTKMDVVSNNIANVSTTGFKAGRVRFQDLISQIDSAAQGANDNLGGVNTQQIGMGVQVSGTDTIMTAGSLQTTGRSLDFGIQNGDSSFFIVSGKGDETDMQYTRDGGFYTDHRGDLVTPSGMRVLGYTPETTDKIAIPTGKDDTVGNVEAFNNQKDLKKLTIHKHLKVTTTPAQVGPPAIPEKITNVELAEENEKSDPDTNIEIISLQSFSIDDSGTITGNYDDGNKYVLGRVALASFTNPDGLEKAGGNLYNNTANSGDPQAGRPTDPGYGQIRSGFLEMSNVDLANEFTEMIVTSRAYQANSRSITTSDEMIQELLSLKR